MTPPAWVFGPVWTVLYILMAIAIILVARRWASPGAKWAVALFAVQLALNLVWSYLFFTLRSPLLALVDILLLWPAIAATIVAFFRVNTAAGFLMVPYLVWVTVAVWLNFGVWFLNR